MYNCLLISAFPTVFKSDKFNTFVFVNHIWDMFYDNFTHESYYIFHQAIPSVTLNFPHAAYLCFPYSSYKNSCFPINIK